jgi:REP element-mobilizing transposase RayT
MAKIGAIKVRQGANLPHWTREGATYAVTFRLADSLPEKAIEKLKLIHEEIDRKEQQQFYALPLEDLVRRSRERSDAYMKILDEGHGECLMARDEVAEIVAGALKFFAGKRYRLYAWCVMPNHVHAVTQPLSGHELSGILHSWKSFTAKAINKLLGRTGGVWQRESYDHLIRDDSDFAHHVQYTRLNPAQAGLRDWKWVG